MDPEHLNHPPIQVTEILSTHHKISPLTLAILSLVTIFGIAEAYFFYNSHLKQAQTYQVKTV